MKYPQATPDTVQFFWQMNCTACQNTFSVTWTNTFWNFWQIQSRTRDGEEGVDVAVVEDPFGTGTPRGWSYQLARPRECAESHKSQNKSMIIGLGLRSPSRYWQFWNAERGWSYKNKYWPTDSAMAKWSQNFLKKMRAEIKFMDKELIYSTHKIVWLALSLPWVHPVHADHGVGDERVDHTGTPVPGPSPRHNSTVSQPGIQGSLCNFLQLALFCCKGWSWSRVTRQLSVILV